jgi:hypothetical protein
VPYKVETVEIVKSPDENEKKNSKKSRHEKSPPHKKQLKKL